MSNLPPCRDFIVATIRKLRDDKYKKNKKLHNTSSGVSIRSVWGIAKNVYPVELFTNSLNELIRDGTIVTISKLTRYEGFKVDKKIYSHP